ncbi:SDR family NAD(P)-dependent oxidoreductase [Metabacillus endolithicus]|uniref:SDR family NAD(P)-dependent oxidoreductase n=1 Tax=Metabacillus endolithicus TaxID=1535204 RepID=UPI002490A420|nr:SDR family NAD(P)-dependent oxidoreductase [Metabacillus endolithicus]
MHYYIVTGASRGLGEAFVEEILQKDHTVICLSRSINSSLQQVAEQRESTIRFEACDLSDTSQVLSAIERVLSSINFKAAEKITLVNNAGTINPIKKGDMQMNMLLFHT